MSHGDYYDLSADHDIALLRSDYDPEPHPPKDPQRGTARHQTLDDLIPAPEPWADRAACRGQTETMFPGSAGSTWQHDFEEDRARAICASCPVIEECRTWILAKPIEWVRSGGIWAGMNRGQAEKARREARAAA